MNMPMQLLSEPATNDVLKSKADLDRDEPEAHDRGGNGFSAPSWRLRRSVLWPTFLPNYAEPSVQVTLVAFVSFLCPGM
jgi:hypothetical protein